MSYDVMRRAPFPKQLLEALGLLFIRSQNLKVVLVDLCRILTKADHSTETDIVYSDIDIGYAITLARSALTAPQLSPRDQSKMQRTLDKIQDLNRKKSNFEDGHWSMEINDREPGADLGIITLTKSPPGSKEEVTKITYQEICDLILDYERLIFEVAAHCAHLELEKYT